MMTLLGLSAAYLTILFAGFGITLLMFAKAGRLNLVECSCLSWLLGSGAVSLLVWICGTFCSGLLLQAVVAIACLALGISGWTIKQKLGSKFTLPLPRNLIEWSLTSLLLVEITLFFYVSFKHTLGWDGLLNWEIKARYAFLNGGVIPGSYYSNPGRAFSHPEYPLGIPFTELWLYLWMGEPHQFWVKTIFPLFYAAGALLLALFVTRLSTKRWPGLIVATLLAFVPFLSASPGGIIVGYADFPMSVFYLAALGYLLCWYREDTVSNISIFAGCLALLPWIKSEGLILWVLLVFFGLCLSLPKHRTRQVTLALLPGLFIVVGWRLYLRLMHTFPPSDFAHPSFSLLHHNLGRLANIGRVFSEDVSTPVYWSIFWLLAAVAIGYALAARKLEKVILAMAVLLPIVLYPLAYVFSTWPSYTAHMTSSLPRLLLHVVPAGWLAIGLALTQPKGQVR
jgi:hypothetical protein